MIVSVDHAVTGPCRRMAQNESHALQFREKDICTLEGIM